MADFEPTIEERIKRAGFSIVHRRPNGIAHLMHDLTGHVVYGGFALECLEAAEVFGEVREREILRCGDCGAIMGSPDGGRVTEEEIERAELDDAFILDHCGCEDPHWEPQRYVTRDMAVDAGDPALEGMPL